jgi:hypothetical protein
MTVAYELRVPTGSSAQIETLRTLLRGTSQSNEINLLSSVRHGTTFLKASFQFRKWSEDAEKKYLDTKTFKSAIPVDTARMKDLEDSVRRSLFEAAESEFLASTLMVKVNADSEKISFRSEYGEIMTRNQAEQVGIYLQQRLELLFASLAENRKFPPIQILGANT